MPMPLMLLPLILAQSGPMVSGGAAPSLNLPMIDRPTRPNPRRAARLVDADVAASVPSRLGQCLAGAGADPDATVDTANGWLRETAGAASAFPQLCLGTALSNLGNWAGAETAFIAGRDAADPANHPLRARLSAMAGNAALADNAAPRALTTFDGAATEARAAKSPPLIGEIEIDRARALVALHREGEAASELADARTNAPDNALGWLLSATLSRRLGHLADAQGQIETAARLDPTDPEIGLEAGVIAELAGHEDLARKSWQSVVAAAPDSDAATHARAYLAQLGPEAAKPAAGSVSAGPLSTGSASAGASGHP